MLTVEKLREYGANVDKGLEICMGNESFYIKMVNMLLANNTADKLKESIDAGDLDAAFEAAHSLKGVAGNLSLTPILDPVMEITELLRSRTEMDYTDLVNEIITQKNKLEELSQQD